jgi:hypothetical protein
MRQLAVPVPLAVLAAAAALATGCGATPAPPSRPATTVALSERPAPSALLPAEPAGEETATSNAAALADAVEPPRPEGSEGNDPLRAVEAHAADEVVRRLEDEGLLVLDLGTELEHADPQRATVVVAVLYGTGRAHPYDARYRVGLRPAGGAWSVVSVEAVP